MAGNTVTEKKQSVITGLLDSYITFIKDREASPVEYENETIQSPNLKSYKQTITNESTKITASNKVYDVVPGNNELEVALSTIATPPKVQARILGRKFEEIGEVGYVAAVGEQANPEAFALTTELPMRSGGSTFICYPHLLMAKELEKEHKEMGSGYEENPDEYTFTAMSASKDGEPCIFAEVNKDNVDLVRAQWHSNPPRDHAEAKLLIETATNNLKKE
ncbi:hypothetical protein [Culicoidibacter larvae]|uniref:Uncharacterized protein n=1 Tax=Culicoidibacter larvae TaxID=2579976 RepID=A0A5R8Q9K5_9FIRM|nr:hypothetical protein [Culicoidibacter larvae]TLG72049.1 hypothetical protein FEZ08_09455 [Culicoidibacter larvae]